MVSAPVPVSVPVPVDATAPPLDQIETLLADLVPLVDLATPERRGRPAIMAAGLVWGALLTAVLQGGSSLRGVWRTIATTGLWHYPAVAVTDEGVRSRLLALGWEPMERLFVLVTTALRDRFPGDVSLAPAFPGGVFAMDATTLDKVAKPFRPPGGPHAALAGRLNTLFDVRRQLFAAVIPIDLPTQNEQVTAPDLIATLPRRSLLLMDRGYTSYPRFDALTAAKQAFITRLRTNASFTSRWVLTDTAVVRDEEIWLGKHRADRAAYPYRIVTIRVGKETRQYLTNVLSPALLPPVEMHRLYRRRWDIERAFKTVKQDLGLAMLWASRWELILIQIWATLVIVQIASALRQEVARRADVPVEEVSLELLLQVLPRVAAHAHQTGQDVLDLVVARGRTAELIRPVRRVTLAVPTDLPWEPPPEGLPTWRQPRYARKP
jgi:Transposase DDE domain